MRETLILLAISALTVAIDKMERKTGVTVAIDKMEKML